MATNTKQVQLDRVKSELPKLSECAVLLNINIGGLSETRVHKAATADLADTHKSVSTEAKVTFNLVSKDAMREIKTASVSIRNFLKEHTVAWTDPHFRACSIEQIDFVERGIRKLTRDFDAAADTLAQRIKGYQEDQRHRLGTLAPNPKDYLTADDIRSRFRVKWNRAPILEGGGDWRFNVSSAKLESVLSRIRREESKKHKDASAHVSDAVFDVAKLALDEISEKLRSYKVEQDKDGNVTKRSNRWTSKLVPKIHALAQRLPVLNLQGDPRIVALIDQVKSLSKSLEGSSDDDLRQDEAVRIGVADKADAIINELEGYGG